MKIWHCIVVGLGLLSPVGFGNEWSSRLTQGDPADLAGQAQFKGETEALLQALAQADGPTLDAHYNLIKRCLPGGHLAPTLSEKGQALAVDLAVRAPKNLTETFFRLHRAKSLSATAELKDSITTALESVPADQRPEGYADADAGAVIDPARMIAGKAVYNRLGICTTCHQADGKGMPGAFPPLAGSPWLDGNKDRLIKIVLKGLMGPIKVGDESYNSAMLPLEGLLTDKEIADVLTYVQNEWGNQGPAVFEDEVTKLRAASKAQTLPWTPEVLLKAHPLK